VSGPVGYTVAETPPGKFVLVWSSADAWETPDTEGGAFTSRRLASVVRYALDHSPGVQAFATREACVADACARLSVEPEDVRLDVRVAEVA
jgi:hypothetical protein